VAIVADSSPLIALFAIGRQELLSALFGVVLIPPAVESEISPSIPDRPNGCTYSRFAMRNRMGSPPRDWVAASGRP
jgi:predicted nucleic acid-binding protein